LLHKASGTSVDRRECRRRTSLVGHWFAQLAPSPAVQFAILDGKGGADDADLGDRSFLRVDDEMEEARGALRGLYDLIRARQPDVPPLREAAQPEAGGSGAR
jgi:hypothetical protein